MGLTEKQSDALLGLLREKLLEEDATPALLSQMHEDTQYLCGRVGWLIDTVKSMQSSLSWKVSAPVRMLHRFLGSGTREPETDWAYLKSRAQERLRKTDRKIAERTKDADKTVFSAESLLGDNKGPILVDATDFCSVDRGTGISRVVGNLCRHLSQSPGLGIIPSQLIGDIPCDATPHFRAGGARKPGLPILSFSEVVLPDASWVYTDQLAAFLPAAKACGMTITTCIHDLIPLDYPEFVDERYAECFEKWFHMMVKYSDNFLCVSETTAHSVAAWLERNRTSAPRCYNIGFWHNGSAFKPAKNTAKPDVPNLEGDYCLMVGGMAPHKNHARVLEAMDLLWQGSNLPGPSLVVAGRTGHATTDIEQKIKKHGQFGRRLFRVENPSDEQLESLYSHASVIVQASLIEGFGLPVAEAAAYDRAVALSDIPIFRELVADRGYFFDPLSPRSIADSILRCFADGCPAVQVPFLTWEDSARQFADVVVNRRYPVQILH